MGTYEDKNEMWRKLGGTITGIHAHRFNRELTELNGKDFVDAYIRVLEFFAPKLARKEIRVQPTDDEMYITVTVVGSAQELKVLKTEDPKRIAEKLDKNSDETTYDPSI